MYISRLRIYGVWVASIICMFLIVLISLFGGRYGLSISEVINVLAAGFSGDGSIEHSVVWNLRLPRILLNCLVGAGLAIAGASFQGIFRNPLVSPDVLGVSSGAAFGAALGILIDGITPLAALLSVISGCISVAMTYQLSKVKGEPTVLSLVLSGMIISAVFGALISLIKYVADPYDKLPAITYWLMGSFTTASYENLQLVSIPILLGIILLLKIRWRINILSLGDEEALTLGVNPKRTRLLIIAVATLITAVSVMVTGIIGWVGLVIPHTCRMLMGVDHKHVLPFSCILGASFVMAVDYLSRGLSAAEIPIGILTALVGAPFFAIIFKRVKGGW